MTKKTEDNQPVEFTGYLVGYARVSTTDQDLALQKDAFAKAGIDTDHVFSEMKSGKDTKRPALQDCLKFLRRGDVLVVWKLDRLGRSVKDLVEIMESLRHREIGFRSLTESLDTTSPMGTFIFHIMAAFAQFERDLIGERTRAGQLAAAKRGIKGGRPRSINLEQYKKMKALRETGDFRMIDICRDFSVKSPSTFYRAEKFYEGETVADRLEALEKDAA